MLAGFTEGGFRPKKISDKSGLLFSLTNRKMFVLVEENKKAITYDDYYLIFGNSEIRLKNLEKKIFSNFGISSSYFNNRGETINTLIGDGKNREI